MMKPDFELDRVENLQLKKGKVYRIQSITHPLTREFFMIRPEVKAPDFLTLQGENGLDLEGTHGCVYTFLAEDRGEGILTSSLVDLKTGEAISKKVIRVEVT